MGIFQESLFVGIVQDFMWEVFFIRWAFDRQLSLQRHALAEC